MCLLEVDFIQSLDKNGLVFGDAEAITARLHTSPTSTTVNTSFVERENFTLTIP
jgi:hypothetical protein